MNISAKKPADKCDKCVKQKSVWFFLLKSQKRCSKYLCKIGWSEDRPTKKMFVLWSTFPNKNKSPFFHIEALASKALHSNRIIL